MQKEEGLIEDKLHINALIPLLILSIVEYEVFTFSKGTVGIAQQDAWLSILIGAVIGSIFVFLMVKLAARFPNINYFQYLQIVWGKPLGFLISLSYLLFWVIFLISIFYETILSNKMLFLPQTPTIIPLTIFALTLVWLVSSGLISIIRFFQLLLPFLAIPLLLLAILFATAIKIDRFLPVFANGFIPVLKGAYMFLGAYQGPEVLLFAAPFFLNIKKGVKPSILAYNTTVFFGWSNTVAAIGILGVENLKESILPGINVVNLLELPGFPVERFGLLLTFPWLIAIYTTLAIYLYLLCSNIFQLFKLQRKIWLIFLITAVPVTLAYLMPNESWHEALRQLLTFITVPIVYVIPAMTLLLAVVRKKGRAI
jgi:spore germination protein (amino acid permease)